MCIRDRLSGCRMGIELHQQRYEQLSHSGTSEISGPCHAIRLPGGHRQYWSAGRRHSVRMVPQMCIRDRAYEALHRAGNMPCIVNAANEVVVAAFLQDKISFLGTVSYTHLSDAFLKKCSSLRGSVMLVGPMVARFGKAKIGRAHV